MGITNLYPNLPGHLVEFKDGGLQLTSLPEDQTGFKKSLLILGTALDGPINEPVKIDETTVTQLFGAEVDENGYPNGATLTKYAKQAFRHGFRDVRCMRVTGSIASNSVSVGEGSAHVLGDPVTINYPVEGNFLGTDGIKTDRPLQLKHYPIDESKGISAFSDSACTKPVVAGASSNIEYGHSTITNGYGNSVDKNGTVYFKYTKLLIKGDNDTTVNSGTIEACKTALGASGKLDYTVYKPYCKLTTYTAAGGTAPGTPVTSADSIATPINLGSLGAGKAFTLDGFTTGDKFYSIPFQDDTSDSAKECHKFVPNLADAMATLMPDVTSVTIPNTANLVVIGYGSTTDSSGSFVIDKTTAALLPEDATNGYTWDTTNNVLTINKSGVDYITVMYYKTVEQEVTESHKFNNDPDDVLPIADGGKIDPSTLVVKTVSDNAVVPPANYSVAIVDGNTTLTFPAGKYAMGSRLAITYQAETQAAVEQKVTFNSLYGGNVYDEAKVELYKDETDPNKPVIIIAFVKPESKKYSKFEKPFYYTSDKVRNIGALRDLVRNYDMNNVFSIDTDDEELTLEQLYDACDAAAGTADGINKGTVQVNHQQGIVIKLLGGDNGLNPSMEEMYYALSGKRNASGYLIERGAYQVLENYHCDFIYPAGVYADITPEITWGDTGETPVKKKGDFHYELCLLCAVLTYRTKMVHGFIDVKPNSNTSLIGVQRHVDHLKTMGNLFYMKDNEGMEIIDSEHNKMDIGWYTSLVVGPDPVMQSDTLGTYYGSAAIAYAALVASLDPQDSPMNKPLPNVRGMKYKLSNKQMDDLIGKRMVCFRIKNEGSTTATSTPYCVDAMTCGGPDCDYVRMNTVSVVTDVVDQIREVADPFIGEPNTIEQRNALSALIAKRLNAIYNAGEVTYYSFEINATVQQVLLGECTISLTLVCPMELRKITTVVSLRAAA